MLFIIKRFPNALPMSNLWKVLKHLGKYNSYFTVEYKKACPGEEFVIVSPYLSALSAIT